MTATIKMTEGQFDQDNKFTQAFENAASDYKKAMQVVNPNYDSSKGFDLMDLLNTPTIDSVESANEKGYFYNYSNRSGHTYEQYATPKVVIILDKTNTHKTGIAYINIHNK